MNMKKFASALLALVMVSGSFAAALPVSAAWEDKVNEEGDPIIQYTTEAYASQEAKLADMILVKEQNGYQIYFEEFTGEIAYVNMASGQILFSNPWDVAATYETTGSVSTKQKLLSQIIITYEDNGVDKYMYSYTDAALRGQIKLKNIKNGVRVEYMIGEEQTTRLVPRMIEKSRFEELILDQITDDWVRGKVKAFYTEKNPWDPKNNERAVIEMRAKFPVTKDMAIYVCDPDIKPSELIKLENYIRQWCPEYSYDELDRDHQMTNYTGQDAAPPLFIMAIEYTILPDGSLEARLPANGIRYDQSVYKLKKIDMLPYFGAGSNNFTGYTFVPDGSGTLVRFEDVKGSNYNVAGAIYGTDYAYHNISNQHTEVMRWPVYGVVTNYAKTDIIKHTEVIQEESVDEDGNVIPAITKAVNEKVTTITDSGYFAVITEGDSMTSLMSEHGGTLHSFNTVYPTFTPRPSDKYNLASSISVGANAEWTVESERVYTGSYRIRYTMLTDDRIAAEKGIEDYYSADYMGMVDAYRDYLYNSGILTPLADTTEDLPLYIETFGSMETTKRVLSFPVTVDMPLTSFEDIKTMYNELSEAGVGRLNFRLTGYTNGGMWSTVPSRVDWMDSVGGAEGFADLLGYSEEKNFGVFPDFDFVYVNMTDMGDGISLSKHAVKTIDDRYTSKRSYDAATQSFSDYGGLCISASAFEHLYEKFDKNYKKNPVTSISVSTLGTDLNSDFDEDDPYNREDAKAFTVDILSRMDADYQNVMLDGGNAYTLPYADHIMKIATDSSRFVQASEAIPFMGMVLHGSKYFTGDPINMEGDIDSAILKAIENGSSLYFILSMQNTSKLKEDFSLSKYYSVSYEIWKDDVVKYYQILNDAIKDLQTSLIVDHEFILGERIPDADELAADAALIEAEKAAAELKAQKKLEDKEREKQYDIMHGKIVEEEIEEETVEEPSEEPAEEPAEETSEETTGTETPEAPAEEGTDEAAEEEEEGEYVPNKYTTTDGTVVRVEYEGGVNFILNYNSFDITVRYGGQKYTIGALGFVRID